jgi:hypothetical protein
MRAQIPRQSANPGLRSTAPRPQASPQKREGGSQRLARLLLELLTVDGNGVQITGKDAFAQRVIEIQVLDPDSGDHITASSDPEKWAELLPTAYRTPYLRAVVTRHD